MNRPLVTALAACSLFLFACGGGGSNSSGPPPKTSSSRACDTLLNLARICYDSSDPGTSCSEIRGTTERAAAKNNLSAELQSKLGGLCEGACSKRKAGTPWSDIRDKMNCDSR